MKLPDMAILLIRLIGQEAAMRMMASAAYGGKNYTVPKGELGRGERTFAALAEVVGAENAKRLCRHFGGDCIYVPMLSKAHLAKRNREIVTAYNNDVTVWQLASKYRLSDRQIRNILKETDMSEGGDKLPKVEQQSLF